MIKINQHVPAEIRIWRVAHAMHANIPRSVVREPLSVEQRKGERPLRPNRCERLDLSLNIVNLFVPPKDGAVDDTQPVKCFRGFCSAFAARHHEHFMHEFIDEVAETGGAIATARIRDWIDDAQRTPIALASLRSSDHPKVSASA